MGNGKGRARPLLRGNSLATVDEAGRLKLPAGFRRAIGAGFGADLYLTSLLGDSLWLYPLAVWAAKERRILELPSRLAVVDKFLVRTSYYGAEARLDAQGRVVLPPILRSRAGLAGEVAVLGKLDHLEVWNNSLFKKRLDADPLTPEDLRALAELKL